MKFLFGLFLLSGAVLLFSSATRARPQKDYLSAIEADKIRDAETPNERIFLFLSFADDRLKKLDYEMEHPSQARHDEMINSLLNAYVGCVDDAADLIQEGLEKQQNIRKGIDLMASKTKEYIVFLQKIPTTAPDSDMYKDNLQDAIEGTQDASREAEAAKKNAAPPPVRRKK
ncbi:MAG TPA: hypothetical protein VJN93_12670 [Candidatus Acidoferrum sp.]|nr:hypothetical protein [Candidatus Acidoferrum sp.]